MIEKKRSSQHKAIERKFVIDSIKEYPISLDGNCCTCKKKLLLRCETISDYLKSDFFFCARCNEVYSVPLFIPKKNDISMERKGVCYTCGSFLHPSGLKKILFYINAENIHTKELVEYELETVMCETCNTVYPL